MKELLNYVVRNWGFECENTVELFMLVKNGCTYENCKAYVKLVEESWAMAEEFGFDL